jgi:hypothetical protein
MSSFDQIAYKIIKEQERVIGPLAWVEASKVVGITVNQARQEASIAGGDPKGSVDKLVGQYERLFGRASREVCRDAVVGMLADLPASEIPSSLVAV